MTGEAEAGGMHFEERGKGHEINVKIVRLCCSKPPGF